MATISEMRPSGLNIRGLKNVPGGLSQLPLIWPALMILGFFAIPLFFLFRVSLANRDPAVYQGTGFSLQAFTQLGQPMVLNAVSFSVMLSLIVASISMLVTFPATYFITRLSRRAQVAWLIGFLSTLALSEVLITFSWQILLSKKAGMSNVLVMLGILDESMSLAPSFGGVVACIIYLVIPFNFMTLYPGLSRLDTSYLEAARTLGARPTRAFFEILLPLMRKPIATAFLTTVIMTIGAYVAPIVLGGPANWTIGVVISEVAITGQNLPLASAIAILLMLVTAMLVLGINRIGGKGYVS
ncbi:spermidine/putrescine ABC transporter permease [Devosia pacifica]|uniref:Spermidine/putrescine ABC transporter permease n=1 Tax=Devosia pacifica TaxID=1335967 RepID=A0A918VMR3_9HYPH|nr:ABC transporter permease [Devosia pacifica]GHA13649.1 spermidine/putrescine ABC transporter permease [Devosia pacifica]